MHAGWAAHPVARGADGTRGVRRPRTCSKERTVLFGHSRRRAPDFEPLLTGLGRRGVMETIAFKPVCVRYMTQPFIDCAIELARTGTRADELPAILCDRRRRARFNRLWEPLPSNRSRPAVCGNIQHAVLHRGGLSSIARPGLPSSRRSVSRIPPCSHSHRKIRYVIIRTTSTRATIPATCRPR